MQQRLVYRHMVSGEASGHEHLQFSSQACKQQRVCAEANGYCCSCVADHLNLAPSLQHVRVPSSAGTVQPDDHEFIMLNRLKACNFV
jgi:hypothetical protein